MKSDGLFESVPIALAPFMQAIQTVVFNFKSNIYGLISEIQESPKEILKVSFFIYYYIIIHYYEFFSLLD